MTARLTVDTSALRRLQAAAARHYRDCRSADLELLEAVDAIVSEGRLTASLWVTTAEAAETLGISARSVRRLAADGEIPARRLGGRWLIPRHTLAADKTAREVA